MRAQLANLNHRAEPFSSRAAVNLCWYYSRYHCSSNWDACCKFVQYEMVRYISMCVSMCVTGIPVIMTTLLWILLTPDTITWQVYAPPLVGL